MCAAGFIQGAHTVRVVNIPGVNALLVKWAPHHAFAVNTMRYIDNIHHPQHERIKRRWETRTDCFWWNCLVSTKVGGSKKVVRGWLNNRARAAITEALRKKGYGKGGARLPDASAAGDSSKGDLVGSAHFMVKPELLHTSWEDLCKQADLIIADLEEKQHRKF